MRKSSLLGEGVVVSRFNEFITREQAIEWAGTKAGNKGFDAAVDAIEMANLLRNIG